MLRWKGVPGGGRVFRALTTQCLSDVACGGPSVGLTDAFQIAVGSNCFDRSEESWKWRWTLERRRHKVG